MPRRNFHSGSLSKQRCCRKGNFNSFYFLCSYHRVMADFFLIGILDFILFTVTVELCFCRFNKRGLLWVANLLCLTPITILCGFCGVRAVTFHRTVFVGSTVSIFQPFLKAIMKLLVRLKKSGVAGEECSEKCWMRTVFKS